ncbi:hypothetical protein [Mangrovicoccus sp. HB161399]|uniref:hypothetical protein n=1 Tax=Mangrovicoccus sp. HB161399 TaxID=2720392 RepID=UPI001556D367|nr:hypothetical protein [Mangrovicoccus sp. HB161399]
MIQRLIGIAVLAFLAAVAPAVRAAPGGSRNAQVEGLMQRILDPATGPQDMRLHLSPPAAPELSPLAEAARLQIRSALIRAVDLKTARADAAPDQRDGLRSQIVDNSETAYGLTAKYRRILNAWEDRGGDPEAILPHRRYLASLARDLVRTTEFRALASLFADWLRSPSGGLRALFDLAAVLAWIFGLLAVSAFARTVTRRRIGRGRNISVLLCNFMAQAACWLTLGAELVTMLSFFGTGPVRSWRCSAGSASSWASRCRT